MGEQTISDPTWLDLYDWRERVARMYRDRGDALRAGEDPQAAWHRFRAAKDALFARHPQSPLSAADRRNFSALEYFPYNPALRLEAELIPEAAVEPADLPASNPASNPASMRFHRAARLRFPLEGTPVELIVYWIDVYGGGLFLPFRDATCPAESYGGGRYLFDTVKGSDFERMGGAAREALGYAGGPVTLDFNYAYNPSCAYDARWICPLAPNENRLSQPIRAGELAFHER
jgi:uncharacterized protein (DUF1684 family)